LKYSDLPKWSLRAAEWAAEYHEGLRDCSVRAQTYPGATLDDLPHEPPEQPVGMDAIFEDFEDIVPFGMTHWQHPRFFAYFPANAAPASMIAEQLANAMSAQCMLWQTSPVATEMEQRMVDWMRQSLGLRDGFKGVIQDSASSATLCAVLTMRERALDWAGNTAGLANGPRLRIYASAETHSSVDKAVRIAGLGQDNLVKVATRADRGMDPETLARAIADDRKAGHVPAGVVLCTGGTSTGAFDPIAACIAVAKQEGLYTHVDAAWAGSAMICPEFRTHWDGVDEADSIVMNPHKWLGANFDCSIQFLADPTDQVRTLAIRPTYLESDNDDEIVNFSEWTIPLGRRFRALKLWFLFRAYGLEGLRSRIRNHVAWAELAAQKLASDDRFEIITDRRLALFTFHYNRPGQDGDIQTERLLRAINDDGRIYLTQTKVDGRYAIRFTIGQFECTKEDVEMGVAVIKELAAMLADVSG